MSEQVPSRALVFGASGTLGAAVCTHLESLGWTVHRATRGAAPSTQWLSLASDNWFEKILPGSISGVIWAQGANAADAISDAGGSELDELFEANVLFVVETLRALLRHRVLSAESGLVIVGSVWQNFARNNKLSYSITKSAVAGLVRSLSADLGPQGVRVNAVLPGVVDSAMSRTFLSASQLERIAGETPSGELVTPEQVASVCAWLAGPASRGVSGQFLAVDGGWSGYRRI